MATVFSTGTYVNTTFVGAARSDIQLNLKTQLVTAGWTNLAYATGQGPGNVGTVTVTIASPGVFTFNSHGFLANDRVILQTTGALPTGLSVNTVYFVRNPTTNTFELSTTSGGASINTTGTQSGTHTINSESFLLKSGTQSNVTNPICVRLKDNRGNCIQVSIENLAGTVVGANSTSNGGSLLPAAAKTFRVLASKYRFECFRDGGQAAREFVMAGMVNVPTFITSVTDTGYMICDSNGDSNTSIRASPRSGTTLGSQNNWGYIQFIWNSNIFDQTLQNNSAGGLPQLLFTFFYRPTNDGTTGNYRWENGDLLTSDVLMTAGLSNLNDEAKIKGQLYDWMYISSPFTIDVEDTFNGHNWHNITNNNTGSSNTPTGGFWIAYS
jgi:hypothetical protein